MPDPDPAKLTVDRPKWHDDDGNPLPITPAHPIDPANPRTRRGSRSSGGPVGGAPQDALRTRDDGKQWRRPVIAGYVPEARSPWSGHKSAPFPQVTETGPR